MISRSLHVPGSPSSALTTRYLGLQRRTLSPLPPSHPHTLTPAVTRLVHEAPLEACWKPRPSPPPQTALLHFVQDPVVTFQQNLLRLVPVTLHTRGSCDPHIHTRRDHMIPLPTHPGHGALESPVVAAVEVSKHPVLVLQTAVRARLPRCRGNEPSTPAQRRETYKSTL